MEGEQQCIAAGDRYRSVLPGEAVRDRLKLEFGVGLLTDRKQPHLPDCGQLDAAIEERHNAALANDGSQGCIDFTPQRGDDGSDVGCTRAILDPIRQGGL